MPRKARPRPRRPSATARERGGAGAEAAHARTAAREGLAPPRLGGLAPPSVLLAATVPQGRTRAQAVCTPQRRHAPDQSAPRSSRASTWLRTAAAPQLLPLPLMCTGRCARAGASSGSWMCLQADWMSVQVDGMSVQAGLMSPGQARCLQRLNASQAGSTSLQTGSPVAPRHCRPPAWRAATTRTHRCLAAAPPRSRPRAWSPVTMRITATSSPTALPKGALSAEEAWAAPHSPPTASPHRLPPSAPLTHPACQPRARPNSFSTSQSTQRHCSRSTSSTSSHWHMSSGHRCSCSHRRHYGSSNCSSSSSSRRRQSSLTARRRCPAPLALLQGQEGWTAGGQAQGAAGGWANPAAGRQAHTHGPTGGPMQGRAPAHTTAHRGTKQARLRAAVPAPQQAILAATRRPPLPPRPPAPTAARGARRTPPPSPRARRKWHHPLSHRRRVHQGFPRRRAGGAGAKPRGVVVQAGLASHSLRRTAGGAGRRWAAAWRPAAAARWRATWMRRRRAPRRWRARAAGA